MDFQGISYALRWHWWHDTKVSCHNTTNTQFIKAKAHPGPCPLAWHSGFTTSKQVQWAGTGAGSSRQQQQTAGESRKQHKKMKQKRICHVWNSLEHEEVQKKETRGVWCWTVIKFWPAEHILNWETERDRDRFGSKEGARRESRQEEAENWSQSASKKWGQRLLHGRKLKRIRGWKNIAGISRVREIRLGFSFISGSMWRLVFQEDSRSYKGEWNLRRQFWQQMG